MAPQGADQTQSARARKEARPMYAVIKTGGKQYRVAKDDVLTVEKLDADAGRNIELEVLLVGSGADVKAGQESVDLVLPDQAKPPSVTCVEKVVCSPH